MYEETGEKPPPFAAGREWREVGAESKILFGPAAEQLDAEHSHGGEYQEIDNSDRRRHVRAGCDRDNAFVKIAFHARVRRCFHARHYARRAK
jgi:hypothetical protein